MEYRAKWMTAPAESRALGYGLSLLLIGITFGISRAFLYFRLPLPFTSFALCAIAITFWYGGIRPGILAAALAAVLRFYFFEGDQPALSRLIYDLIFLVFAVLMTKATRARDELELRVTERTADLTDANESLKDEIAERRRTEEKLQQSEAYLAEAQKVSHTGSFGWHIVSGKIFWSDETFRIFELAPATQPTLELIFERIHPEDTAFVRELISTATQARKHFDFEHRLLMPNDSVKYLHIVAHAVDNSSGDLEYVGAVSDVTERVRADQEREMLRQAHADLARVSRVTTMGELTASLAHELNQPIAAAVTDATTCLSWLNREHPDTQEACEAASRMVTDATRAAEIISRIRLMFTKGTPERTLVDINEVILEMIALLHNEITRNSVSIQTMLAEDILQIMGDRIQLQQVIMNLIVNSIEAMKEVDGRRELVLKSQGAEKQQITVSVSDTGVGLPQGPNRIFDAFFTTKLHGTGMGLRISRSIIESHGGHLWAADNLPRGASFCLTLPGVVQKRQ
jgi:C4-dicarboxylate-specific signal transduction histidine kinase